MSLHSVILAGGSGTRFWPCSRQRRPKQFLPLVGGQSLLQTTVDRVADLSGRERTWILTNPVQAQSIGDVLPAFPMAQVMVEPEARDTAPCIALAAAVIEARDPGAYLAIMPADHLIQPKDSFQALLRRGEHLARETGHLVTFGIEPDHPATGFGYIEKGEPLDEQEPKAYTVARFREKPNRPTAQEFLDSGRFLWNAGIFLWSYQSLLAATEVANPELAGCMATMLAAAQSGDDDALAKAFRSAPRQSVDFAVMERAPHIAVVEAKLDWSDLGSFLALGDVATESDNNDNHAVLLGNAKAILEQSSNCIVYGETDQTISVFGAEDMVVVAVNDAIMVCPKDRAEDLKQLIEVIKERGRTDLL